MTEKMVQFEGLPMKHVGLKVDMEEADNLPPEESNLETSAAEMVAPVIKPQASVKPMDTADKAENQSSTTNDLPIDISATPGSQIDQTLNSKLDDLHHRMVFLNQEFQSKLKYDAHKEKVIDALHKELQDYKNDIIKKQMLSVFMDVIKVIDDIRKWTRHYRSQESASRDPLKLFKFIESIPSDLEDIFYWQGVKSFVGEGPTFDPTRQRVSRKIETSIQAQDHTVAESLRPGYEWEGKIIRPEMVALYCYKESPLDQAESNEDE